jgi:hypothetical protein
MKNLALAIVFSGCVIGLTNTTSEELQGFFVLLAIVALASIIF